jgi:hypothetical protein
MIKHDTLNIIKTARAVLACLHDSTTLDQAYLSMAKQNTLNIIKMLGQSWHASKTGETVLACWMCLRVGPMGDKY